MSGPLLSMVGPRRCGGGNSGGGGGNGHGGYNSNSNGSQWATVTTRAVSTMPSGRTALLEGLLLGSLPAAAAPQKAHRDAETPNWRRREAKQHGASRRLRMQAARSYEWVHETCLQNAASPEHVLFTPTERANSFEPQCQLIRHQRYYGSDFLMQNATPTLLKCLADRDCNEAVSQKIKPEDWPFKPQAAHLREVAQVTPIPEVRANVDLGAYVRRLQPFILRGGASQLPAQRKWTDPYLIERIGTTRNGGGGPDDPTFARDGAPDKDVYFSRRLPSQLDADAPLLPLFSEAGSTLDRVTFWYSSIGQTSSVLHRDDGNFFIAQVHGSKNVTLVDPEHSLRLYADFGDSYHQWTALNLPPHHPVLTCPLPLVPRGR